jgi:hypothetical protein
MAYNSLWQLRNDTWSGLEEATTQLALADSQRRPVEKLVETVTERLDILGPIERFWAFPGAQIYQEVRRLFAAGKYDRLAAMVGRANRALVTESYRGGQAWDLRPRTTAYDREAGSAKQSGGPALLRGSRRRGPDRGAGARAARGAAAVAPSGRPVRLRDRRGAQLRRRAHGRAAELQAAGVRGPPPVHPPVPPRLVLARPVRVQRRIR